MRGAPSRIYSPLILSIATMITLQPAGPPGFLIHAPSVYATVPRSPNIERAVSTGTPRNASKRICCYLSRPCPAHATSYAIAKQSKKDCDGPKNQEGNDDSDFGVQTGPLGKER